MAVTDQKANRRCSEGRAETHSSVSANPADDDVLIMRSIREITGRGNNAEVKRRSDGRLAVYEVKKSITIG